MLNDCEDTSTISGTPKLVEYGEICDTPRSKLLDEIKIFVISGVPNNEREEIMEAIQRLGGIVSQEDKWTNTCTTLIIHRPLKTEKFLCAAAKCIPIVTTNYIIECSKAGSFLSSEKHLIEKTDEKLSKPYHYWLNNFKKSKKRPFHGLKVYLFCETGKKGSMERFLTAGGAEVIQNLNVLKLNENNNNPTVLAEKSYLNKHQRPISTIIDVNWALDYWTMSGMAAKEDYLI